MNSKKDTILSFWNELLQKYCCPNQEFNLFKELIKFKQKIFYFDPEADPATRLKFRQDISKELKDALKEHYGENKLVADDFNYEIRLHACMMFIDLYECSETESDFELEMFVRLLIPAQFISQQQNQQVSPSESDTK